MEPPTREEVAGWLLAKCEEDKEQGCWLYIGSWNSLGYGRVLIPKGYKSGGKHRQVLHLAAYAWCHAPWHVQFVCHRRATCPPACFRPEHLLLCQDRAQQMRHVQSMHCRRGLDAASCKLSKDAKEMIFEALAEGGETAPEIAERVSEFLRETITPYQVRAIRGGDSWVKEWRRYRTQHGTMEVRRNDKRKPGFAPGRPRGKLLSRVADRLSRSSDGDHHDLPESTEE